MIEVRCEENKDGRLCNGLVLRIFGDGTANVEGYCHKCGNRSIINLKSFIASRTNQERVEHATQQEHALCGSVARSGK